MSENITVQSDKWWETGVIYQIYPSFLPTPMVMGIAIFRELVGANF